MRRGQALRRLVGLPASAFAAPAAARGVGAAMAAPTTPQAFPVPIRSYDVHIYFLQHNARQTSFARSLREEVLKTFPDLKVYAFHEKPIGPHPVGMFEVDIHSPQQFSAFVPWLTLRRGDLSALVHPNTGRAFEDHTKNALWLGDKLVLDTDILKHEDVKQGVAHAQ